MKRIEPIKMVYDRTGNTLYVRFSDKEESHCTESDAGKEIIFLRAEDNSIIGFEILNFLPKGVKLKEERFPVETEVVGVPVFVS